MDTHQTSQNARAQLLKSLHIPGTPLILTNIWDAISAGTIASLPSTRVLATASAAVAQAAGLSDQDLTLELNLAAARAVSTVAAAHDLPLTVDFQDGYGARLEEGVQQLLALGVVGINLEDFGREVNDGEGGLYSVEEAQGRIRRVLEVGRGAGVGDFVVNARTDALLVGGDIEEAIRRGKAYLEAGAANVFIWGGKYRGGMTTEEVERACRELGGMLNVSLVRVRSGGLSVGELRTIGVARISVGPQLMVRTQVAVREEAERILKGEGV